MSVLTIELTAHAVDRYVERVRPGLAREVAEAELAHVVLAGEVVTTPPAWHLANCAQVAPSYLVVADVLLPLVPRPDDPDVLVATTCLAKGSLTPEVRRRRTRHRRRQGAHRGVQVV